MPNFVARRLVGGSVRLAIVLIALTILAVTSNCGAFGDNQRHQACTSQDARHLSSDSV